MPLCTLRQREREHPRLGGGGCAEIQVEFRQTGLEVPALPLINYAITGKLNQCVLFDAKLTTGIIQRVYSSINKLEITGEHPNDTNSILYKGILPS